MCQVWVAGKKAVRSLQQISAPTDNSPAAAAPVITLLKDQVSLYRRHLFFKEQQQRLYRKSIDRCTGSSCVVTMDFKENFRVGGGPVETGRQYFNKKQVSVLSFAVHYRDVDGDVQIRYLYYFS